MLRLASLSVTLVLFSIPAFAQRLPENVVPSHYDIAVTPDLASAKFAGTERITATLKKPADTIVLNAAEIEFDTVTIKSGTRAEPAKVSLDATKEQATLTVGRPLPAGAVEI